MQALAACMHAFELVFAMSKRAFSHAGAGSRYPPDMNLAINKKKI
jgi:hypothetical protein